MKYRYLWILPLFVLLLPMCGCSDSDETFFPYGITQAGGEAADIDGTDGKQDDDGDDTNGDDTNGDEPVIEPNYVISAKGGDSEYGMGGWANWPAFVVDAYADVSLLRTGTVDTAFDLPGTAIYEDLGDKPLVVQSGWVLQVVLNPDSGAWDSGGLPMVYMLTEDHFAAAKDQRLYISDGDDILGEDDEVVTGLRIEPQGVLVLPPNKWIGYCNTQFMDNRSIQLNDGTPLNEVKNGKNKYNMAELYFERDVIINGLLKTMPIHVSKSQCEYDDLGNGYDYYYSCNFAMCPWVTSGLDLRFDLDYDWKQHMVVGETGMIDTSGYDAEDAGVHGGYAGRVWIRDFDGLLMYGMINAAGGDGRCDHAGNGAGCETCCICNYGQPQPVLMDECPCGVRLFSAPTMESTATTVITGTIDVSGGSVVTCPELCLYDAGQGGSICVLSSNMLFNTGNHMANGGTSCYGGYGGSITFMSLGSLYNSGELTANGGTGMGYGGNICLTAGIPGFYDCCNVGVASLINSGDLSTNGGDGCEELANCGSPTPGGSGGGIALSAFGGDVRTSGELMAKGGDGCFGGWGGVITFRAEGSYLFMSVNPPGIEVTNNLSVEGGEALECDVCMPCDGPCPEPTPFPGMGGYGGTIYAIAGSQCNLDEHPVDPVKFVGYSTIDISGGEGYSWACDCCPEGTGGGGGGGAMVVNTDSAYDCCELCWPIGGITNEVDVLADGGDATDLDCSYIMGGYGGYVLMDTSCRMFWHGFFDYINICRKTRNGIYNQSLDMPEFSMPTASRYCMNGCCCIGANTLVNNSGDIDVSGGDGPSGGDSGGVLMFGYMSVTNSGDITAEGGDALSEALWAGDGADLWVILASSGDVMNSGNILARGGEGLADAADGGDSDELKLLAGQKVSNSGTLDLRGGDSYNDESGDGGDITITSHDGPSLLTTDNITVSGGTTGSADPSDAGEDGEIMVDGINRTGADGWITSSGL